VLSRELADFLVEFSIALQKHAIYPSGHPLLNGSVESVARRLDSLLVERMSLAIGVARRQLVIEGVATDPDHPLLQELAGKLHRHHLGAVKFSRGVDRTELADALVTLGAEAARGANPLGMSAAEVSSRWDHVRIFPLTYDRLELLDQQDQAPKDEAQMRASRAAELWVGLARAALMADTANDDEVLEPTAVAKAIDEHAREQAYDQVIVGYLLQIAQEIRVTQGKEAAALQRRVSKMVSALNPETLKRLLDMGGDVHQRRRFVLDAAQGMTVEAVVDLVKAAADAEGQVVSNSFIRMLSKLALHARKDEEGRRRALAEGALRDQVVRLLGQWNNKNDPNPTAYRLALEHVSRTAPAEKSVAIPTTCEPDRVVKMALEVGVTGPKVAHAVEKLAAGGNPHVALLLDMLEGAPEGSAIADGIWEQLVKRDTLRQLLKASRVDVALVERFAKRQGFGAATVLLDALASAPEGKWHERLVDTISGLGDGAAPAVLVRMRAAPWPLQRDCLAILARLPTPPRGFDATGFLKHVEPSVRREAARLLLRMPELRDRSMITALADSDERVVFIALNAALEHCSGGAARLIMRRVEERELKDATLRVRAAAAQQTEESLDWLVRRVVTRSRWLKRPVLAPRSAEVLAALSAIAGLWRDHPKSAMALALAAKSTDSEVRLAVTAGAVRVHRREGGVQRVEGGAQQHSTAPSPDGPPKAPAGS
jgi:hypothetical protein